jgi:tetratricopeptide (TPR) repeat protein
MDSLEKSIQKDPRALRGRAQRTLAKLYFDAPPILGGDTSKALSYFTSASEIAPDDIQALNGIAACNLALGNSADALASLRKAAPLAPKTAAERQLFVDEWRTSEGLAVRAGDPQLAAEMGHRRSELLKSHAELLARNSDVVLGHGGSNPITGATQYIGDVNRPAPEKNAPTQK